MAGWRFRQRPLSSDMRSRKAHRESNSTQADLEHAAEPRIISRWGLGILNDRQTDEVPGSVVLLSKSSKRNEPLGLHHTRARTSSSSTPSSRFNKLRTVSRDRRKKTSDGRIVLEPQPDDSHNDPLNWPSWRRNLALLALGFYCMLGGGMTPILAAGYNEVSAYYGVGVTSVPLTTGLYMMGMGIGSVLMSPTAILFGKRPVYLCSCILFILSSIWCALSPSFSSLVVARIVQGVSVSPVECLPSASIAEIFFLHERAYRLGIYTLLLLGGKNLIPLVSAAIIQGLSWQWVFWITSIVVAFGGILLFLFVPESFWDRTPRASDYNHMHVPKLLQTMSSRSSKTTPHAVNPDSQLQDMPATTLRMSSLKGKDQQIQFKPSQASHSMQQTSNSSGVASTIDNANPLGPNTPAIAPQNYTSQVQHEVGSPMSTWQSPTDWDIVDGNAQPTGMTPALHNLNSPWYTAKAAEDDYFALSPVSETEAPTAAAQQAREEAATTSQSFNTAPAGIQQQPLVLPPTSLPDLKLPNRRQGDSAPANVTSQPTMLPPTPLPVLKLPNRQRKTPPGKISLPPTVVFPPATEQQVIIPPASEQQVILPPATEQQVLEHPSTASGSKFSVDEKRVAERSSFPPVTLTLDMPDHIDGLPEPVLPSPDEDAPYTEHYRAAPQTSFVDTLRPYSGRLSQDSWGRVALRPFILFSYPAILWSAMVYSLSVGWLIVLSESVTVVYQGRDAYNFTSVQVGLVYLSPFIGGILGTAVAGKVSDIIVRFMARRNGGIYEPEFRLVMAVPTAITSVLGLMGFGWSAAERDNWFVPTFFFGVISFGCCLGSTTSITFAVDSYRQYAGEALVTLNFSKNILHGLVFSLFFTSWLENDGSKRVFLALGGIQLGFLLLTVPMYIFGKRARMWTVRMNLMERF